MATVVVLCILPLCWPHPLSVSDLCLPLNCLHLACINASTPLQINLVSPQSLPDRTSRYRGSYSFLAPVYTLSIGESIYEKKGLNPKKIDTKGFSMDSSSIWCAE